MGTWGVGALVLSWGWCPGGEGEATVDRREFVPDAALLIGFGPDKEPSVSGNVPPAAGTAPPPPQEAQPQPCLSHQAPLFPRQWNPNSDSCQLRPEATPSPPPPPPANVLLEAFLLAWGVLDGQLWASPWAGNGCTTRAAAAGAAADPAVALTRPVGPAPESPWACVRASRPGAPPSSPLSTTSLALLKGLSFPAGFSCGPGHMGPDPLPAT